jgi:uncharacterized membrane protein YgdD (TMEM256/DUF423 family)
MIQNRKSFIAGSLMVLISILIGAFAAHALKKILPIENLSSVETGARYLMYSGLGLLVLSLLKTEITKVSIRLIIIGTILFSGSIFLLTCMIYSQINFPSIIGVITPIGGMCMIFGWILLIFNVWKQKP